MRRASTVSENRTYAEWKCYGSTDGITFEEIVEGHQLTRLTLADYSINTNRFTKTLPTQTKYYNWIGFCVNKLVGTSGNDGYAEIQEIRLYGNEDILSEDYALKFKSCRGWHLYLWRTIKKLSSGVTRFY